MGIIIPTLQRNKLRLKMLLSNSYNRLINREMGVGATVAISFGKPGTQEDGGLVLSQRTILAELEFRFISTKRGGVWLVAANFLVIDPGLDRGLDFSG